MARTRSLHFHVVDVFTKQALEGNSLAVFPKVSDLDDVTMQKIAREMNLSETVFVFAPSHTDFAARLRIFTPFRELPFAGHPTIGATFVLREEGIIPWTSANFVLQEEVGPVPIRVEGENNPLIWLTTPLIHEGPVRDRQLCAEALGLSQDDLLAVDPQILSAGNPTIFVAVKTPEIVDRASIESSGLRRMRGDYPELLCAFVFAPTEAGAYSRMFAPDYGIPEDPATGSSTGPLGAYMVRHDLLSSRNTLRFISEQGTKMGRRSLLHVRMDSQHKVFEVGGHVTPLIKGVLEL